MGYRTLWDSASVALILQSHLEQVESPFKIGTNELRRAEAREVAKRWRNVHLAVVQRVFAFHAGRAVNRC
jgi:hypothetical protein